MPEKLYTTNQLATVFGVVPTTVIDWIERGKLAAFKTLGGHRRITHSAVLEFLNHNRLQYPPALAPSAPGILIHSADAALTAALRDALQQEIPAAGLDFCDSLAAAMLRAGAARPRLLVLDAPDGEGPSREAAASVLNHFSDQPPAILLLTAGEASGERQEAAAEPYAKFARQRPAAEIACACASLLRAPHP